MPIEFAAGYKNPSGLKAVRSSGVMTRGAINSSGGLVGFVLNQTHLRVLQCMTELPSMRGGGPGPLKRMFFGYEVAHVCSKAIASLAFVCMFVTTS